MAPDELLLTPNSIKLNRAFTICAICIVIFFTALRFFHIEADFPANFTWSGSLYSDEGNYSSAAVSYMITGQWYREGDFNLMVNLPIYHLIQAVMFKAFGLSLHTARLTVLLLSALISLMTFFFVRRYASLTVALLALVIISVNFNLFAYSRLSLIDIPVTFFAFLSIFIASKPSKKTQYITAALTGLVFAIALLTKTTAVFVLPILLLILIRKQTDLKQKLIAGILFTAVAGVCLLTYYFTLVKMYPVDYHFYYNTNIYTRTQFTPFMLARSIVKAVYYSKCIDVVLYPLTMIFAFIFIYKEKTFRSSSLFWISIIWIVGYLAAIGTQNYVPPRYFTPIVIPVSIISAMIIDYLIRVKGKSLWTIIFVSAVVISLSISAYKIVRYTCSPVYSWIEMTDDIKRQVELDDIDKPVLLSHFGNSLSMTTGIASINETWGTASLAERIEKYQPDYYLCVGSIKEDVQNTIETYYSIEQIKTYDVFNNYYTGEPVAFYRLSEKQYPDSNQ